MTLSEISVSKRYTEDVHNILDQLAVAAIRNKEKTELLIKELMGGDKPLTLDEAITFAIKHIDAPFIEYANGSKVNIKSYLTMAYKTNYSNLCRKKSFQLGEELNTNVYKVSSHGNPRVACSNVQGKLITFGSTTSFGGQKVLPASAASYGAANGLGGVNCMHNWYPMSRKLEGIDLKDTSTLIGV